MLIAALGSSPEFDISNFSVPLGDVSVAQISGLGSDLSVTSRQRLNSMYGSYVSTSAIGAQVTDDPIADLDGDSGVEPNSIVLSDLSVWVPSVAGMQVISVPRSQELSESIDPLSDFNDAVINSADSTGSPLVGAIQSLGRYHTVADSAGVFVESDANASAALLREPPDRYHIRFHMEKANNPLPLFFIGDIGNPLRDVLGSVPRAINSDVLRLCMPGQPYGGSSFECFDTIVVECSRVVCFDLRDLFLTDKVRLYHQRSVSMPASSVGLSGSPLSVSPSSLEWMHASDLRDAGFTYVNNFASVSIVLASPDPMLFLVFRDFQVHTNSGDFLDGDRGSSRDSDRDRSPRDEYRSQDESRRGGRHGSRRSNRSRSPRSVHKHRRGATRGTARRLQQRSAFSWQSLCSVLIAFSLMFSVASAGAVGSKHSDAKLDCVAILRVLVFETDVLKVFAYVGLSSFALGAQRSQPMYKYVIAVVLAALLAQWLGCMMGVPGQGPSANAALLTSADAAEYTLSAILAHRLISASGRGSLSKRGNLWITTRIHSMPKALDSTSVLPTSILMTFSLATTRRLRLTMYVVSIIPSFRLPC
jgi:hypothetical protein